MTPLMLVAVALMVLFGVAALLVLLSANDTAAEWDDLAEQVRNLPEHPMTPSSSSARCEWEPVWALRLDGWLNSRRWDRLPSSSRSLTTRPASIARPSNRISSGNAAVAGMAVSSTRAPRVSSVPRYRTLTIRPSQCTST